MERYANLLIETAKTSQVCARRGCKNTKAADKCARCLVDEEWAFVAVSYCGRDCQKADWATHKPVCLARRKLIRGVRTAREMSYVFEDCAFGTDFKKATADRAGNITIHEYVTKPREGFELIPGAFKGGPALQPWSMFALAPMVQREAGPPLEDLDVLLRAHWITRSLPLERVFWQPLLNGQSQKKLDGLPRIASCQSSLPQALSPIKPHRDFTDMSTAEAAKDYRKLYLIPKNTCRSVSRPASPAPRAEDLKTHCVLLIISEAGEEFIVDMMGIQLGYKEVLSLRTDFDKTRASNALDVFHVELGADENGIDLEMTTGEMYDDYYSSVWFMKQRLAFAAAAAMGKYLQEAQPDPLTLDEYLNLKEPEFSQRCTEFRTMLTGILYKVADSLNGWCLCLTQQMTVTMVSNSGPEFDIYKGIWLTQEEWEPIRDKPDQLVALWLKKLAQSPRRHDIRDGPRVRMPTPAVGVTSLRAAEKILNEGRSSARVTGSVGGNSRMKEAGGNKEGKERGGKDKESEEDGKEDGKEDCIWTEGGLVTKRTREMAKTVLRNYGFGMAD